MVRNDLRPKPAYRALATLGRTLAGMQVTERVDVGAGAYAFRFTGGEREVIAACAPQRGRLLAFESATPVTILNGVGEMVKPIELKDASGRPVKCITLDNGFPVYISPGAGSGKLSFKVVKAPITIVADSDSVRPGGVVRLQLTGADEVSRWEVPFGWTEPRLSSSGGYKLEAPEAEAASYIRIQAFVNVGGQTLRLPIVLDIDPAVIRL